MFGEIPIHPLLGAASTHFVNANYYCFVFQYDYETSLHEFMAWPHLATAIFRGVMEPEMMSSLLPFLEQLGQMINGKGTVGRHREIQWWGKNAPWLPGNDPHTIVTFPGDSAV